MTVWILEVGPAPAIWRPPRGARRSPARRDLYRIRFHRIGDDPRVALRASDDLDALEVAQLVAVLSRSDWAAPTLQLIAEAPGIVSTDLAATLGVDRALFKQRVRRLKTLGLTESLDICYRLSPRGRALLARITLR